MNTHKLKNGILLTILLLFISGCSTGTNLVPSSKDLIKKDEIPIKRSVYERLKDRAVSKKIEQVTKKQAKTLKIHKFDNLKSLLEKSEEFFELEISYKGLNKQDLIFYSAKQDTSVTSIKELVKYINKNYKSVKITNNKQKLLVKTSESKVFKNLTNIKYESHGKLSPYFEILDIAKRANIFPYIDEAAKKKLYGLRNNTFKGNAYEYLSTIASNHDLFFFIKKDKIEILSFKEKVFPLAMVDLKTSTKSSNEAASKETKMGDMKSTSSVEIENSIYEDLKNSIATIIKENADSKFSPSSSTSQLVINATPSITYKVDNVVSEFNNTYSKNILVKIKLIEVLLKEERRNGIDVGAIKSNLEFLGDLGTSNFAKGIATNSFVYKTSKFNSVIKMINEYGETKVVSEPQTSTLNTIETSIFLGSSKEYLSDIKPVYGINGNGQLVASTYSTKKNVANNGISLIVKPVIKGDAVQLMLQAKIESIQGFDTDKAGDVTIKSAEVKKKDFFHMLKLKQGQSFMIAGIKEFFNKKDKQGMPFIGRENRWFDFIAGERGIDSYEVETVLVVSVDVFE